MPIHTLLPPFTPVSTSFWTYKDTCKLHLDHIQMTSSDLTKIGSIWNNFKVQSSSWSVALNYTRYNTSQSGIATTRDKIALWYTSDNDIDADYILEYHLGHQKLRNIEGFLIAVESHANLTEVRFTNGTTSRSCQQLENSALRMESLLELRFTDGTLVVNHTNQEGSPSFCVIIVHGLDVRVGYFFGITASTRITERTFNVNSFLFDNKEVEVSSNTANPEVVLDEQIRSEIPPPAPYWKNLVYGQMVVVLLLVVVVVVVGIAIIRKLSSSIRESTSQTMPELIRLASFREEGYNRNSDNTYQRTQAGSYYQRTPSGNYHIYENPRDLMPKKKDDYDHLNFNR